MRIPSLALVSLATFAGSAAAASPLVLNEVLYDPGGADAGLEFVEISAAVGADSIASLAGWVLESGNGASPGAWTVEWTGGASDRLREGLFVVGETGVEPPPDAVANLDLQNGPDACRLRGPQGQVDVLGWGEPLATDLREGAAAPDVSARSLSRLPDGFDTGDNAADFFASEPSPGVHNAPETGLVVEKLAASPSDLSAPAVAFTWTLRNVGREPFTDRVRLLCDVHPLETLAIAAVPSPVASGDRVTLMATVHATAGVHLPRSEFSEEPLGPWRGEGDDLLVSEVLPRPGDDTVEWIELFALGEQPVNLGAFTLADAAGTTASLAGRLDPGHFALVTPDRAALRAAWTLPPDTGVIETSRWPALNHTAPAGEIAETIVLSVRARAVTTAALPGGAAQGVSWERVSRFASGEDLASWGSSLDPEGGTPGRRNSRHGDHVIGLGARVLAASPSPFRPARDRTALIVLRPGRPARSCRMTVFDSSGSRVATLSAWRVTDREHRALWDGRHDDGRPAALGLYLVHAEAAGFPAARASLVLVR